MTDAQAHALPMADNPNDPPDATAAPPSLPPSPLTPPLTPPLAEADSAMVDGPDSPLTLEVSEGCGEEASGVPAPTAEARAKADPRGPWEGLGIEGNLWACLAAANSATHFDSRHNLLLVTHPSPAL